MGVYISPMLPFVNYVYVIGQMIHTNSHAGWGWGIQVGVVPFRSTDFVMETCTSR